MYRHGAEHGSWKTPVLGGGGLGLSFARTGRAPSRSAAAAKPRTSERAARDRGAGDMAFASVPGRAAVGPRGRPHRTRRRRRGPVNAASTTLVAGLALLEERLEALAHVGRGRHEAEEVALDAEALLRGERGAPEHGLEGHRERDGAARE